MVLHNFCPKCIIIPTMNRIIGFAIINLKFEKNEVLKNFENSLSTLEH